MKDKKKMRRKHILIRLKILYMHRNTFTLVEPSRKKGPVFALPSCVQATTCISFTFEHLQSICMYAYYCLCQANNDNVIYVNMEYVYDVCTHAHCYYMLDTIFCLNPVLCISNKQ